MIFHQFYLGCLAHASYLIGDEKTGQAAVVDPQRDVQQYLDFAAGKGLAIRHVFLSHFHADFLAGHIELRDRTGAAIRLGSRAEAEYAFVAMKDGESLDMGDVRMTVLETPGHSPESISLLVRDLGAGPDAAPAVLTGDTLFNGDVGRPDLRGSLGWSYETLGGMLYDSLHTKLLALPDATRVYPAHGAGTACGKRLAQELATTIGDQRRFNYALQPMSREEFIRVVAADQPDAPAYFTYDAVLNTKERPTLERMLESTLRPLALEEVLRMGNQEAQLLDVRESSEYAAAHLVGTLNVGLGGAYATWAGTLLSPERPIVLVAPPGREGEAAMRLGRIGFDRVAGYLQGGMEALIGRPDLIGGWERMSAGQLAESRATGEGPVVLDVRTDGERAAGSIEGSVHIPLTQLERRAAELPRGRAIVAHCAGGYRSTIAVSLLRRQGFVKVTDLVGGIAAWQAARLPA